MKLRMSALAVWSLVLLSGCAPQAAEPTATPRPVVTAPSPEDSYPEPDPDYMDAVLAKLGPVPPSASYTPEQAAAALVADADLRWETVKHVSPEQERPTVTLVRQIEMDEYIETIVPCLRARGVRVTMTAGDRGFGMDGADPADYLSRYVCEVEYPVRPQPPFTAEQLGYVYDYFVQFKQPCLEDLGYEVRGATPSKDFFVTNWPRQNWNPSAVDIDDPEMVAVELACPNYPEGLR